MVTVRSATPGDLDAILDIENGAFSDPWSDRSFAALIDAPHAECLVLADDGGAVIGYVVLLLAPPEADVANVAVAARVRRTGAGRALLRAALDAARQRGIRQVYLEVRASNVPAIGLYRSLGFFQVGVRAKYYSAPREDALVMRCDLVPETE